MNKMKLYIFLLLSTTVMSCNNFLDINPKAEVVNDDMFNNKQGCEDALTGIYGDLKTGTLYGEYLAWGVTDVLAQDFSVDKSDSYGKFANYIYNDVKTEVSAIWTDAYRVIGYANNAIEILERRDPKAYDLYDLYLGEAYGVRAFLHFEMLRLFAPHVEKSGGERGIPYVKNYSFKHTPFSTVNECYALVIEDLKKAQQLLQKDEVYMTYPRQKEQNVKQDFLKGRELHFNYYAATALLARVYWTKGDLVSARTEALKVIDSDKFPLAGKDEIAGLIAGALSPKESIWGLYSTDYFEVTKKRFHNGASWEHLVPYQAALGGSNYPNTYVNVYSQYLGDNAGVDARLNWFQIIFSGETRYFLKSADKARITVSTNTPASRGLLEGISMLRIPEMYYIVAEAFLAEDKTDKAAEYIDPVLLSRGMTQMANRVPALVPNLQFLYNERHKEYFGEGQRWFDMKKRNEDIVSNMEVKTLPASDQIYVLPIPVEEFDYRNE